MARATTDPAIARPALRPIDGGASETPLPALADDVTRRLVERARAGELEAWARLYQDHYDALFRHLCFLCGNATVAEDLVQETFARAMARIETYDGRGAWIGWLRGIGLNVARMHWRRAATEDRAHDQLGTLHAISPPSADLERRQLQDTRMRILYEVLSGLPDRLREAFVLRELEGLSPQEAGALLGISPGNLAVRASRARARIRRELARRGWLSGGDP